MGLTGIKMERHGRRKNTTNQGSYLLTPDRTTVTEESWTTRLHSISRKQRSDRGLSGATVKSILISHDGKGMIEGRILKGSWLFQGRLDNVTSQLCYPRTIQTEGNSGLWFLSQAKGE